MENFMKNKRLAAITFGALATLAACGGASDVPAPANLPHQVNATIDWRDQVIYQLVVDRFFDGDTNNDINVEPTIPGRYHGGDWQGVIDKLDYLQTLGVTTLWISPVVKNVEEDSGFGSYHGYWTQDPLRPNAHFGDVDKLRELVDAAHARGMLVLLDIVTNHMGQLFFYDINGNGVPDDSVQGGGYNHTCLQICDNPSTASQCSADELTYCAQGGTELEQINEYDPDYDPRTIQGWSSLGFSGDAKIIFPELPEVNKTIPPRPPEWFGWPQDKPWFDDPSWYHRKGRVYVWWHEQDYSNDFVREQETTGDFPGGLKDLNTDNADVKAALIKSYQYWIEVADFDGFRVDTMKHIDRPEVDKNVRGFWGDFVDAMRAKAKSLGKQNFFVFGEAFDGNDQLDGSYTFGGTDSTGSFGRFDSIANFPQLYEVMVPVFQQGAVTKNIECLYNSRIGRNPTDAFCQAHGYWQGPDYQQTPHAASAEGGIGLPPTQTLVNFLDNHDLPRFLFDETGTVSPGEMLVQEQAALYYLFTWDGIPCVYYGTEQQFSGGVDPANREDLFAGNPLTGYAPFDTEQPQFKLLAGLIKMRKDHEALRRGDVSITWSVEVDGVRRDQGIFGFERSTANEKVLVVLNSSDQTSEACAPNTEGGACMTTSFPAGTVLKDVAPGNDGQTFTVGAGGTVDVTVPSHVARVLLPS